MAVHTIDRLEVTDGSKSIHSAVKEHDDVLAASGRNKNAVLQLNYALHAIGESR
jgi:hypothetical protein